MELSGAGEARRDDVFVDDVALIGTRALQAAFPGFAWTPLEDGLRTTIAAMR